MITLAQPRPHLINICPANILTITAVKSTLMVTQQHLPTNPHHLLLLLFLFLL